MHISANLGSILFGFSLFFLLIYKLAELVKSHMLPFLRKQIRLVKKEQVELWDREKLVTSTLNKIDNQRNQQKKMFVLLEKKMRLWHKEMLDDIRLRENEFRDIADDVAKKRKKQDHNFSTTKTMLKVLPTLLQETKDELLKISSDDDAALKECIQKLGKAGAKV